MLENAAFYAKNAADTWKSNSTLISGKGKWKKKRLFA
jgi:hypothetical protein